MQLHPKKVSISTVFFSISVFLSVFCFQNQISPLHPSTFFTVLCLVELPFQVMVLQHLHFVANYLEVIFKMYSWFVMCYMHTIFWTQTDKHTLTIKCMFVCLYHHADEPRRAGAGCQGTTSPYEVELPEASLQPACASGTSHCAQKQMVK